MKLNAWVVGISSTLSMGVGLCLTWFLTTGLTTFTSESWRRADVRANPRLLPDVMLQDHRGHEASLSQMCNKVLIIDFIYSRCDTVCRAQGAISSQIARRLSDLSDRVQVLSISFDPENDHPAALSKFKRDMEPSPTSWTLARTSSSPSSQALIKTFGVVVIPDDYGGYDHNSALHIVSQCKLVQVIDFQDMDRAEMSVRALIQTQSI